MIIKKKFSKALEVFEETPIIGVLARNTRYPLKKLLFRILPSSSKEIWKRRMREAVECPDNAGIPRVSDAGKLRKGVLIMHNGVKVHAGSYYGEEMRLLLSANRGVHEPQEEKVFQEVLKSMPEGASMLELGAYWAFYSLWFHSFVTGARCYLCEPNPSNLKYGYENFELNGFRGTFMQSYSGGVEGVAHDGIAVRTVDGILEEQGIERLNLLHSDIQGFEHEMLLGAHQALSEGRIDYVFVSSHKNELHTQCLRLLQEEHGYSVVAEANLDDSYSVDGLLVAKRPGCKGIEKVSISKKTLQRSKS